MYECEHCKNTFKTKSSLNQHQNHAKYCLELRDKQITQSRGHHCEWCNKLFTRQYDLCNHRKICKEQISHLKKELKEVLIKIELLKQDLKDSNKERDFYKNLYEKKDNDITEMAQRPTTNVTTTNNTRNNLVIMSPLDLSPQRIKDIVENSFAIEHFNDGQKGIANFAVDFILRDEEGNIVYRCGDCTRQTFRYKDVYDQIKKDIKAQKLTKILAPEIKWKTTQLAKGMYSDDIDEQERVYTAYNSIQKIDKDNTEFVSHLTSLTA